MTMGLDAIPVSLDHPGELPGRLQPLPPQGALRVLEGPACLAGPVAVPDTWPNDSFRR